MSEEPKLPEVDNSPGESGDDGVGYDNLLISSLCRRISFIHFVVYMYLCHPSHLVSTGHVNHPPLLFSTSIALGSLLISGLT